MSLAQNPINASSHLPDSTLPRFVTAASLFDGHDVSINIMRRLLQSKGVEVIHLGHNRSAKEVVDGVSRMQGYRNSDALGAISKLKKEVWQKSLTLLQEIYFITPDKVYERIVTPTVYVEEKKKEEKKPCLRRSRRKRRPRRLGDFSNLKL